MVYKLFSERKSADFLHSKKFSQVFIRRKSIFKDGYYYDACEPRFDRPNKKQYFE